MTTIRRLEARDRAAWDVLFRDYRDFYRAKVADTVIDGTFERLLEGKALLGLVAVDEADRPIGLMHLVFHPSTWAGQDYCYIEDLFVARDARGTGASRTLFARAYAEAEARGAPRVYWLTQEYNAPARSLYDTLGRRTSFIVYER